jgi:hypothetical protein
MARRPSNRTYYYVIDLDERGEFYADVRDYNDKTVFIIEGYDIFEDGWMKHKHDLVGLEEYLKDIGIISPSSSLVKGN